MSWKFINGLTDRIIKNPDPRWISALEASLKPKATPTQSGHHVNIGMVTKSGHVGYGANHECGTTETITHGEEAALARVLDDVGKNDAVEIIAFAGEKAYVPSPCGKCRDGIKEYTNPENLVIIGGSHEDTEAIVTPGRSYFKDQFQKVSSDQKERIQNSMGLQQALIAYKTAYDIYSNAKSPPIYGAAIVTQAGIFRGSHRGNVAYNPDYPISAAIGNFRDGSDYVDRKNVHEIIILGPGIPNVMYKDRQDALEFAQGIQSLNGRSGVPLPIYLVAVNSDQVLSTDTNEWLPLPFSPAHLGMESKMEAGILKLFE